MHYFCISFTHKNTDISIREKLSFSNNANKKEFLNIICANENIKEGLVISTCNRIEILTFIKNKSQIDKFIISSLSLFCNVDSQILFEKADIYEDSDAVHHLFAVASSLDSLVVGETQIVKQLKDAFIFALENKFCSMHLSRIMHFSFKCAAKVRNQTQISKNPISVASVCVTKAKEFFDLTQKKAIVIGAGEMSELASRYLISAGAKVIILNRDLKKAKKLCENLGESSHFDHLSQLSFYINDYDLFFSATNASNAIITKELLKEVDFKRYFFDIAVPRDIELEENDKIKVFSIDDLEEVVKKNLILREHEAQIAYKIVNTMTDEFFKYLNDLAIMPVIKAIRLEAKECATKQLEIALNKGYLKKSDFKEAQKLIHQVFKAFLHTPTINLKKMQGKIQSDTIVNAMRYVFDIKNDLEDLNLNQYKCEFNAKEEDEIQ